MTPAIEKRTRTLLGRRLARFGTLIERVDVRFKDVNGPRGGADTVARIHLSVQGRPAVFVEERALDAERALARAAVTVTRAMDRSVGKRGLRTPAPTRRPSTRTASRPSKPAARPSRAAGEANQPAAPPEGDGLRARGIGDETVAQVDAQERQPRQGGQQAVPQNATREAHPKGPGFAGAGSTPAQPRRSLNARAHQAQGAAARARLRGCVLLVRILLVERDRHGGHPCRRAQATRRAGDAGRGDGCAEMRRRPLGRAPAYRLTSRRHGRGSRRSAGASEAVGSRRVRRPGPGIGSLSKLRHRGLLQRRIGIARELQGLLGKPFAQPPDRPSPRAGRSASERRP